MTLRTASRTLAFGIIMALGGRAFAQTAPAYQFTVDLVNVQNDRVTVELAVPPQQQATVTYNVPKVIPGTYANYNFGRFIHNFQALDAKGKPLPVTKASPNTWQISDAKKLKTIRYEVEDTWDTDMSEDFVFEPAGSNIEAGEVFLLNQGAYFGYLNDLRLAPYRLTVKRPADMYGSTSLVAVSSKGGTDVYEIGNYMDLVDAPILYTRPDTAVATIGGAQILVSVYSKTGKVKAAEIAPVIFKTVAAQKEYLGGKLPVNKYAFLIYLTDKPYKSGAYGALEHSYSSVYSLLEGAPEQIAGTVTSVAAHEFFHIITPLSIHSEEIGNFDYLDPKMSQHLWLYEGVTEYFAQHAQVHEGLMDVPTFLTTMRQKMQQADRLTIPNVPFTEFSAGILREDYNPRFGNVYAKGALIGMLLDIRLHDLSGGKYSLVQLMEDLSKTYGKDKSFKDNELFDQIAQVAKMPQLKDFFAKYVAGTEPLPFADYLQKVGIRYVPEGTEQRVTMGGALRYDATKKAIVFTGSDISAFGKQMGYQADDELVSINGTEITLQNAQQQLGNFGSLHKAGETLTVVVRRNGQEVTLSAPLQGSEVAVKHLLELDPNASEAQVALRKSWLED